MASAVLLTYERHYHKRNSNRDSSMTLNTAMKPDQKISKGSALEVVPLDLSLHVDSVAEPDGRPPRLNAQSSFGTSANAPSETVSEDSFSFRRKSMSLNGDGMRNNLSSVDGLYDFSHRNFTSSERKDIRKRLKLQLDVVLELVGKLEAREMQLKGSSQTRVLQGNQVEDWTGADPEAARFTSTEGQFSQGIWGAGGKEKRTPKVNQLYVNSEFVSGTDKGPLSEKLKAKPPMGLKRNFQEKLNAQDPKRPKFDNTYNKKMTEIMRKCSTILKNLMSHKHGWVFNAPVDVVNLGLDDYLTVIKKPMDLGTIKAKLASDEYSSPLEFAEDVRLTFNNAMLYNPKGNYAHEYADVLKKIFENRWKSLEQNIKELHLLRDSKMNDIEDLQLPKPPQMKDVQPSRKTIADSSHLLTESVNNKKPIVVLASQIKSDVPPHRIMTFTEKRQLSENLENLTNDNLEQVLQIIKSRNPNLKQTDDEIEVDIDSFDTETLWELHRFVENCSNGKTRGGQKVPGVEANMREPSNGGADVTSVPRPAHREQEVDINSGNVPMNNYTPVVIEKEAKGGGNTPSSSSESESSSDTDVGSSPEVEADGDHSQSADINGKEAESALPCGMSQQPLQEPVGSGAVRDQRGSPTLETDTAKRSMTDVLVVNLSSKAAMSGAGVGQGESVTAEGQVSPEKLLRAALLKNRFAETILKAQEKSLPLNKADKSNPEKLKKDREELERRQREERARLQAEAKAAELAQRMAEAQAAAEARRKREEEREAARLALQKMEKTVEIDENSGILKDLELLRTVHPEHIQIQSSGEDTSAVHTPDGLPAFALQAGNPLEQLGLFMKIDEEEEEEHEKVSVQQQKNRVNSGVGGDEDEEGEIED